MIPKFIKQLLSGRTPTIHGDGKQTRDFTYIENVIEANLKACKAGSEYAGEVFNIAYGERTSLLDVYRIICNALGKSAAPAFDARRKGDIMHSNADIRKARRLLGYEPEYSFAIGIQLAIDYYVHEL